MDSLVTNMSDLGSFPFKGAAIIIRRAP